MRSKCETNNISLIEHLYQIYSVGEWKVQIFLFIEIYYRTHKGSSRSRLGPEKEPILNGPSKSKKEDTNPKQIDELLNVKIVKRTFWKIFILDWFLVVNGM